MTKHKFTHNQLIDKMKNLLDGKLKMPEQATFRKSSSSGCNIVTLTFSLDNGDFQDAYDTLSKSLRVYKTVQVSAKSPKRITLSEYGVPDK